MLEIKHMKTQNGGPPAGRKSSGMAPGMEKGKEAERQPENETLPTEQVKLANPEPEQKAENPADEQALLPHERDETTRRQGTSLGNEDERSRAVMGQAAEDTKRGLKDTDRRGIPSDIIASDVGGSDAPERARKKKR